MKINFPRVTQPLDLSDYLPALSGQVIHIWVNAPRDVTSRFAADGTDFAEVVAELWSQHDDKSTHWTIEEVNQLISGTADNDPGFFKWAIRRTGEMISEYRNAVKKE